MEDYMRNVTISLDDDLLKASRRYAKKQRTTLNNLIRKFLKDNVIRESSNWLEECFKNMDRAKGNSKGRKWKREDLYDD